MPRNLDEMLQALSGADLGAPAAQAEEGVWARIAAGPADASPRVQIAAATVTVALGLAVGLFAGAAHDAPPPSADYAQYGPLARLTAGL